MPRTTKLKGSYYQRVEGSMWGGESFSRLTPLACSGQALWLLLLTCPERHDTGIWRMGFGTVVDHSGWEPTEVHEAFQELERERMATWDQKARILVLTNAVKRLHCQSPNVALSWGRHIASLPRCPMVLHRAQELKAFAQGLGEGFSKAFAQGLGEGFGESELELNRTRTEQNLSDRPPSPHTTAEASGREPWEDDAEEHESKGEDIQKGKDEEPNGKEPPRVPQGFKGLPGLGAKVMEKFTKEEAREIIEFLLDRFPEVSEDQVGRLLRAGLQLQGAYRVASFRHKIESNPATRPMKPGAYWYTCLMAEATGHSSGQVGGEPPISSSAGNPRGS